ncbi:hypothetical protein FGO68_gene2100 [Halteria grandinella]|uniref:Uncharacterized protein n=1 Tax=Halteria grandinella TaxID=5974 RepID=A0A8J8P306_HALGN|nr:hypothetical protein FGO68_gene2100 [Halteria grandinella]
MLSIISASLQSRAGLGVQIQSDQIKQAQDAQSKVMDLNQEDKTPRGSCLEGSKRKQIMIRATLKTCLALSQ